MLLAGGSKEWETALKVNGPPHSVIGEQRDA